MCKPLKMTRVSWAPQLFQYRALPYAQHQVHMQHYASLIQPFNDQYHISDQRINYGHHGWYHVVRQSQQLPKLHGNILNAIILRKRPFKISAFSCAASFQGTKRQFKLISGRQYESQAMTLYLEILTKLSQPANFRQLFYYIGRTYQAERYAS